ncbi:alpha/beta hydrolase [Arthrobacter sp. Br18]|uniref:alpha/beta fold hydrolase n=1 Tax=Arthrobacter sp. Br18 TaxID=1312954 RepID=UPI0004B3FB69|nr:alpha/beta hydrolase [Arthrobacter sp. Br18]
MPDVEERSCRIHSATLSQADPDTPVFVMVHGIGLSHRYFDRLQAELIQHGHTHVLDLPGFGGTPTPEQQLEVDDYAAVIGDALDAAGIDSCVLIGHSMGAQFVTELALQRPDVVSELVLIGPVTDSARRSVIWHTLALGLDSLMERPLTNAIVFTDYARCGLPWYFTELPVMLQYRLHERLPQATQPVLIIRGSNDPVSRRPWCSRLVAAARDGRLVEIPGQPHVAHRGGAQKTTEAIVTLLHKDNQLSPLPGNSPVAARQQRRTILRRLRTMVTESRSATSMSGTPDFQSITVDDRQCRAYPMMHTRPREPDAGAGAAETTTRRVFVLIHGIGMSHRYFTRLAAVLADHGDTYLIDLPGYGWTGTPAQKISNPANADLIGALLDEIGVSSCTVVGHSMGVQSATELAITRPDLVTDLVLIGAAVDAKRRTVLQQALRLGMNSTLEKPPLNTVQFLDILRCGPRWYFAELAVALAYHLEERLPLVGQKVLIMRGTRDLIAGTHWSRTLADTAQHGELLEIPGKPHAVHHSDPATVAAAILTFAADRDGPAHQPQNPEPELTHQ